MWAEDLARLPSRPIDTDPGTLCQDLLRRFETLHPREIDLSLARIRRLLAALGHPERRLPPVVHVAGTNGKGSVIAILRAIAEAAGKRVHAYTSPHLVDFTERIALASQSGALPISAKELLGYLRRVEAANKEKQITLFEITTAAALLAFSEVPADLVLLETGLGGRLDATNVVSNPNLTIITSIDVDHVEYLGPTLAKIAAEKAGIIKRSVPCICAQQAKPAREVISRAALKLNAPIVTIGQEIDVWSSRCRLMYRSQDRLLSVPLPTLEGAHQIGNAGLAIAAAYEVLGSQLSLSAIEQGLVSASWPARLQRLTNGRLSTRVGDANELWLDGAHNVAGAQAVAAWLSRQPKTAGGSYIILGMMENKDARGVVRALAKSVDQMFTVPIPNQCKAFSAHQLSSVATSSGIRTIAAAGFQHALSMALSMAQGKSCRIVICGSLYLAGHVLKAHSGKEV